MSWAGCCAITLKSVNTSTQVHDYVARAINCTLLLLLVINLTLLVKEALIVIQE